MLAADNWEKLYGAGGPVLTTMKQPSRATGPSTTLSSNVPTTQVELSISCRGLKDLDLMSKSDPQCFVYLKDGYQDNYFEVGRTEMIDDNLNPDFVTKVRMNFNFEEVQRVKFDVWDIDPVGKDFLGSMETTLAEIVACKGRQFVKPLIGKKRNQNYGQIIVVVEEVVYNKQIITFTPMCSNLRKDFISKRDTFIQIWKTNEDGSNTVVHKSEVFYSSTDPFFKPITLRISALCSGDLDRNIQFDVMKYSRYGDHRLLGSAFTTVNNMIRGGNDANVFTLSKKTDVSQGKLRGVLHLKNVSLKEEASFLDYIRGGTELHFAVAVDFTASNGPATERGSLHFLDPMNAKPNYYEIALRSIAEIISHYDTKGMYASFGFGAIVPPNKIVSHIFPLNGNNQHPYCNGVDDLINCYKNILSQVIFYGPTNFAPIIQQTAEIAKKNQSNGSTYFILLIITDGIICDMNQTKKEIIKASHLPLSIIIVGVGNADFSAMDELDSDDALLSVDRMKAVRDIVQFVPLNRFLGPGKDYVHSMIDLAKEVLFEVPGQVTSFMSLKGLKPLQSQSTSGLTAPSFNYSIS